jgi:hypothetical protein
MSYDQIQEDDVPPFTRRVGDTVYQGSNNTILIFGTDRAKDGPAKIGDGLGHLKDGGKGKGTGTIHLIAGRKDKDGDPDFQKDLAFVYLTMKSKIDTNLKVDLKGDAKIAADNDVPGAIMKADHIRFVARKNVKICLEDSTNFIAFDKDQICISVKDGANYIKMVEKKTDLKIGETLITIDGDGKTVTVKADKVIVDAAKEIDLGKDAAKHILQSEAFLDMFDQHMHPTGVGPSGPPITPLKPMSAQLDTEGTLGKPEIKIP